MARKRGINTRSADQRQTVLKENTEHVTISPQKLPSLRIVILLLFIGGLCGFLFYPDISRFADAMSIYRRSENTGSENFVEKDVNADKISELNTGYDKLREKGGEFSKSNEEKRKSHTDGDGNTQPDRRHVERAGVKAAEEQISSTRVENGVNREHSLDRFEEDDSDISEEDYTEQLKRAGELSERLDTLTTEELKSERAFEEDLTESEIEELQLQESDDDAWIEDYQDMLEVDDERYQQDTGSMNEEFDNVAWTVSGDENLIKLGGRNTEKIISFNDIIDETNEKSPEEINTFNTEKMVIDHKKKLNPPLKTQHDKETTSQNYRSEKSTSKQSSNGKETSSKLNEQSTPDKSTKTPDKSTKTPDKSTKTPDKSTNTPDKSTNTPDKSTKTPNKSTKTPDKSTKTPDKSTKTSTKTPDKFTKTPGKSTKTPDKSTKTPDKSTKTPDKSTKTPDKSTKTPDKSTKTPDKSTKTPDKSTKTSETPVTGSNLPEEVRNFKSTLLETLDPKKTFVDGRRIPAVELLAQKPTNSSVKVYLYNEFISDEEADGLIKAHDNHVKQASKHDPILCFDSIKTLRKHLKDAKKKIVVTPNDFTPGTTCVNSTFSIKLKRWFSGNWSYSTAFYPGESPFSTALAARIQKSMGLTPSHGGKFQLTSYPIGKAYKAHTDCIVEGTDKRDRMASVLIYLNDVEDGGKTDFPDLGIWVKPRKGRALLWNNMNSSGYCEPHSRHEAEVVKKGQKYILIRWYYYKNFYSLGKRPHEPIKPEREEGQPRVSCDEYNQGSCRWYDEWGYDHLIEYEQTKYTLI